MARVFRTFFIFLFCALPSAGFCQRGVVPLENGPVHEAFATPIVGTILLDAVPTEPPAPIQERIPKKEISDAEWISGYWKYNVEKGEYIWVSGLWRRPPPQHQWIDGFWEKMDEGYVWISGFWSQLELRDINYIQKAPPAPVDEKVGNPPKNNMFWDPGFWAFSKQDNDFFWVDGNWEELDPDWVLVPEHYTWRPEGYVFIPSYWDWPIEDRGTLYAPVTIQEDYREGIIFVPEVIYVHDHLFQYFILWYPDYICHIHHHWHFHPNWWNGCGCVPPWWHWSEWWVLPWHDHWGLWWWWAHPGFPAPIWITIDISNLIPPPGWPLLGWMKDFHGPVFITPNGLINPHELLEENQSPILPGNKEDLGKLIEPLKPKPDGKPIRPGGKRIPSKPVPKPDAGPFLPPGKGPKDGLKVVTPPKPDLGQPSRPPIRPVPPPSEQPRPRPRPDNWDDPQGKPTPPPRPRPRPRPDNWDYPQGKPTPPPKPRPRPQPDLDYPQGKPTPPPKPRPRPQPEWDYPQTRPKPPSQSKPEWNYPQTSPRPRPSPQSTPQWQKPQQSKPRPSPQSTPQSEINPNRWNSNRGNSNQGSTNIPQQQRIRPMQQQKNWNQIQPMNNNNQFKGKAQNIPF